MLRCYSGCKCLVKYLPDSEYRLTIPSICSIAESNLSIICASLLTVKVFISSVAPSLLGAIRSGSRNNPGGRQSISNPPEIVTFGGGGGRDSSRKTTPRHNKYEPFEYENTYPLTTLVDVQAEARECDGSSASQLADTMSGDAFDGNGDDDESTRGIVVPRTDENC